MEYVKSIIKNCETVKEFEDLAENWYARLNRLKHAFSKADSNSLSFEKNTV